jgi:hypothetical protein
MSRRYDTLNFWPQGPRNSSAGSVTSCQLGEYAQAIMVVHVSAISGSLVPRWQIWDGARYVDLARGATCTATGPSATILAVCGNKGRPSWTISGAGANIIAGFSVVAKE